LPPGREGKKKKKKKKGKKGGGTERMSQPPGYSRREVPLHHLSMFRLPQRGESGEEKK